MKLLVIDDESTIRRMIAKIFQHEGWEVIEAADGTTGVLQARIHLPDVVLCDFEMNGVNGFQTLAQLRAVDATATIPFILITGVTERAGIRHSMELGADDYLAKPFEPVQLIQCVQARLARVRLEREQAERKLAALRTSICMALPHALKTPLNGIVGYSDLLASDFDAFSREEIREMTTTIRESATVLDRLVNRFLDYTQLALDAAAGSQPMAGGTAAIEVEKVARRVTERHRRQADLGLNLGLGCPAMSQAHLCRLTEELVDNACQYSAPQSRIDVTSRVEGRRYVLDIRDAGRGLTTEQIAQAGAFMQFDRRHYEQQGTGLGLATAKRIAELNDGALTLKSEPGRGTTATVELPAGA